MSNLIDDGNLIGFWPLFEPSGAPSFKNYSPARAGHPSGISFDLQVHTADTNALTDDDSMASPWPGTTRIFNEASGTWIRGLQLQGKFDRVTNNTSAPFSRCLILGQGTRFERSETLSLPVENSGITAGIWIYPNSDGWITAADDGAFSTVSDSWYTGYMRTHAIMGHFHNDLGWMLGVSGELEGATQFGSVKEGGPHQLRGSLLIDVGFGVPLDLSTPIESGRYTHLTMSYRYTNGNDNEVVLYKDGRVAASGQTNQDIVLGSTTDASVLCLGAGTDGALPTDGFEYSTGWDHLVSGAYFFRRVLDEGEILSLHECGGLQPDLNLRDDTTEVEITDSNLVAYVSQMAPGWVDASKNNYHFHSEKDPGDRNTGYTHEPGPLYSNRNFSDGSNLSDFIAAPSGATYDLANAEGGFTICGFFHPTALANDRDGSMMISWGSVSSATTGPATSTGLTNNTLGITLTYFFESGFGDRVTLEVFPVGDLTDGAQQLRIPGEQLFRNTNCHYGVVYDAGSNGIALYVDGYQAASGTLIHNLKDQVQRLAGSGYPVMFQNGIRDEIDDINTKNVLLNGGDASSSGPYALFSRPLRADEMRAVAQSGINTNRLWRTKQDPRLRGFWGGGEYTIGDIIVEDGARRAGPMYAHLTRGDTFTVWDRAYNRDNSQDNTLIYNVDNTAKVDLYGERVLPPELAGFGNLGITSGVFTAGGGTAYAGGLAINSDSQNSAYNLYHRYKPAIEERDFGPQNLHEYIISFEVTPSGDIPSIEATSQITGANQIWFNSRLHTYGNIGTSTNDGEFFSFLTTLNADSPDPLGSAAGLGGSGVTIGFVGKDGASSSTITPIISGTLSYGVPTRVLFHAKFDEPYRVNDFIAGNSPMTVSLWIDGEKVNQRTSEVSDLRIWSDQAPGSSDDWLLQFGGYAGTDNIVTQMNVDGGLGEIYMRNIFVMRGIMLEDEVAALAASGIQDTFISGYINSLPKTQVTISDDNLEGYWRFNGFDGGGSGTTDLSSKNNHLAALAQQLLEEGTSVDLAESMHAMPGPRIGSDLGVRCSGFHNAGVAAANTDPNMLAPFAVSGSVFDNPQNGFSVGFLLAKRDDVGVTNGFDCMLCYGTLTDSSPNGTVLDSSLDPNRGWAIGMDDSENIKMVLSLGGTMYLDPVDTAAQSGQIVAKMTNITNPLNDNRSFNNYQQGDSTTPHLDGWHHVCWVYDPDEVAGSGLRMYFNGVQVDEIFVQPYKKNADGTVGDPILNPWNGNPIAPQVPLDSTARMMTFKSHQAAGGSPWDFGNNSLTDVTSVMTDVFYFSRALSEEEVRYISFFGIDDFAGTPTSGSIGGYVQGQDTGSGIIGGYSRGQEDASGVIGGYIPAGTLGSGIIGGYVSGVVFGDGTIGGWIQGLDNVSGILGGYIKGVDIGSGSIAGYIRGQEVGSGSFGGLILAGQQASGSIGGFSFAVDLGSGHFGGFMLGGLQSNFDFDGGFTVEVVAAEDFDAQLEIRKVAASDFDAKVVIFQDEQPPLVAIDTPNATVTGATPPFNQYFIGKASGQQGKTIDSTRWTFGDFSPGVSVAQSGAGCYPIQHQYASSGLFIAKFEAVDSEGLRASATRIIDATAGVPPAIISLSGVPRSGNAALIVDFTTTIDSLPPGVSVSASLLDFDDGQKTAFFNPTHSYQNPGVMRPIWCIRDSRGFVWCDSLEAGGNN